MKSIYRRIARIAGRYLVYIPAKSSLTPPFATGEMMTSWRLFRPLAAGSARHRDRSDIVQRKAVANARP